MRLPKLLLHRHSGQWRVCIKRRWHYLGRDQQRAESQYRQLMAQYIERATADVGVPTVADVVEVALAEAATRFKPSRFGGEAATWRYALRWLDQTVTIRRPNRRAVEVNPLSMPADDFTAMHLDAIRASMIAAKRKRSYINGTIRRICDAFAAARIRGVCSAATVADLRSLPKLREGYPGVKDSPPVQPADDATVAAVLPFLSPQMAALVQVLRLTGMRVGELVRMRVGMLDTRETPWVYSLGTDHKTSAGRYAKRIFIGPKAAEIIAPFLDAAKAKLSTEAPVWPPLSGNNQTDTTQPSSIVTALKIAASKAGVPHFTAHQLRHTKATAIAESEALKAVKAALGHGSESSSRIYAELDSIAREQARLSG